MSLVTRCTACGTVFRVVQDQLKVSSGWVRCGRCGEVFNALQTLFDLDRDAAPVPGTPPPPPPGSTAATVPSSTPVPAGVQPMPSGPPATGFGALDDRWRTLSRQQAPARTVPEPAVDDRDIAGAPPFATSAPSPGEFQASLLPPDSAIDDDERADTCPRKLLGDHGAERAAPGDKDAGARNPSLPHGAKPRELHLALEPRFVDRHGGEGSAEPCRARPTTA